MCAGAVCGSWRAAAARAKRQLESTQRLLLERAQAGDLAHVRGGIDDLTSHIGLLETAVEGRARA